MYGCMFFCVCLSQGVSPLFSASRADELEAAQWLVAHGGDPFCPNDVRPSLNSPSVSGHVD